MLRKSLLLLAGLVAAGGIGCAHCDTCDDFPLSCAGGNCFGGGAAMAPPTQLSEPAATPIPPNELIVPPPVTSQPGPFNGAPANDAPANAGPANNAPVDSAPAVPPAEAPAPAVGNPESPPSSPAAPGGPNA